MNKPKLNFHPVSVVFQLPVQNIKALCAVFTSILVDFIKVFLYLCLTIRFSLYFQ